MKKREVKTSAEKIAEDMTYFLKAIKQIGGDLDWLHGILIVDEDYRQKVDITIPYLYQRVLLINDLLRDYSCLPDEFRKGLKMENRKEGA